MSHEDVASRLEQFTLNIWNDIFPKEDPDIPWPGPLLLEALLEALESILDRLVGAVETHGDPISATDVLTHVVPTLLSGELGLHAKKEVDKILEREPLSFPTDATFEAKLEAYESDLGVPCWSDVAKRICAKSSERTWDVHGVVAVMAVVEYLYAEVMEVTGRAISESLNPVTMSKRQAHCAIGKDSELLAFFISTPFYEPVVAEYNTKKAELSEKVGKLAKILSHFEEDEFQTQRRSIKKFTDLLAKGDPTLCHISNIARMSQHADEQIRRFEAEEGQESDQNEEEEDKIAIAREWQRALEIGHSLYPDIRKIEWDWKAFWGDGGNQIFQYPVFSTKEAYVDPRLAGLLRAISAHRQDVQPNGVVSDIIDPSLHSLITGNHEDTDDENEDDVFIPARRREKCLKEREGTRAENAIKKTRGTFVWVPTIFQCTIDERTGRCTARAKDSIRGLPPRMESTRDIYEAVEKALGSCLPILAPLLEENVDLSQLQVVVKAQEYVLPPKSKYTGRWHTEGHSENIFAAAVLYVDVDPGLAGGALQFRPAVSPGSGQEDFTVPYTRRWDPCCDWDTKLKTPYWLYPRDRGILPTLDDWENSRAFTSTFDERADRFDSEPTTGIPEDFQYLVREAPVKTGTAFAFLNSVPHRFRTITNDTDEVQRRLFINFFFVDPSGPLKYTTDTIPDRYLVLRALASVQLTRHSVQEHILSFLGIAAEKNLILHALLRDRAREAMSRGRHKWGHEMWGNAGYVQFRGPEKAANFEPVISNAVSAAATSSKGGSGL